MSRQCAIPESRPEVAIHLGSFFLAPNLNLGMQFSPALFPKFNLGKRPMDLILLACRSGDPGEFFEHGTGGRDIDVKHIGNPAHPPVNK